MAQNLKKILLLFLRNIDYCAALSLRMHSYLLFRTNLKCDLIISGSHSRHGLEVLLGSTAHKILNLAKCDVLLVRCPKD